MGNSIADATACISETPSQQKRIPITQNYLASFAIKSDPVQRMKHPASYWLRDLIVGFKHRVPVTQNHLASLLAAEASGEEIQHPAAEHFCEVLYESIERMIYCLCRRYSAVCNDDVEDLVHDCMANIAKKIGKYDSSISSFTTWSWHISRNMLASKTRRAKKTIMISENVSEGDIDGYSRSVSSVFEFEIKQVIRDLIKQHPKRRQIVFAMFGNPSRKGFFVPDKIEVRQVARTCNVPYQEAYLFYRNIVRPFFKERFDKKEE